jgi:hypothetical protein
VLVPCPRYGHQYFYYVALVDRYKTYENGLLLALIVSMPYDAVIGFGEYETSERRFLNLPNLIYISTVGLYTYGY